MSRPRFHPIQTRGKLHNSDVPEGKTDAVDEEDQYRQAEHPQQGVHPDLQVRQPSGALRELAAPSPWDLHLGRVAAVVPRLAGAAAPTAAPALPAGRPLGDGALGRCADLNKNKRRAKKLFKCCPRSTEFV